MTGKEIKMNDTPTKQAWGYTSYRSCHNVRTDGRKLYFAHFLNTKPNTPLIHEETCTIMFWANRPILALRHIISSVNVTDRSPVDFHLQTIN